jgi:outer membrane lipoprotein-sorting protein
MIFAGTIVVMLAAVCSCGGADAVAPSGGAPGGAPGGVLTLDEVLDRLDAKSKATQDLVADFTRTRTNPYSRRPPKVVTGRLMLKVPGMVRLVFEKPKADARELGTNGARAWEINHPARMATVVELGEGSRDKLKPEINAFLAGMGRDVKALKADYNLKLAAVPKEGGEGAYEIAATAKPAPEAPYYKEIRFRIDAGTWIPTKLEGTQPSLMVDTWEFTNIKTNTGVRDSEFGFSPPFGYTVRKEDLGGE